MRRQTLTIEEETFLDQLRLLLLQRSRSAALDTAQAQRLLNLYHCVLNTSPELSAQVGEVCRTGEVCDWLGISRQAVHKAIKDQRLLAFRTLDHKWIYPVWQFEAPEIYAACIHGLPPVLDVLDSRGVRGFEAAIWFVTPNSFFTGSLADRPPFQAFHDENPPVDTLVAAAKRAKPPLKPHPLPRLSEIFGELN